MKLPLQPYLSELSQPHISRLPKAIPPPASLLTASSTRDSSLLSSLPSDPRASQRASPRQPSPPVACVQHLAAQHAELLAAVIRDLRERRQLPVQIPVGNHGLIVVIELGPAGGVEVLGQAGTVDVEQRLVRRPPTGPPTVSSCTALVGGQLRPCRALPRSGPASPTPPPRASSCAASCTKISTFSLMDSLGDE